MLFRSDADAGHPHAAAHHADGAFGKAPSDVKRELAIQALREFLRPEFIGRVDEIVVFNELSSEDYARIAVLMLDELKTALRDKSVVLEYTEAVPKALVEKMDGNVRGARDLRNVIRRNAEDKISSYLVEHYGEPIKVIRLTAQNGEIALSVE